MANRNSKDKNVRTKTVKSERIELRCTKAFKESLLEMSVQNNTTISKLLESICTDKINEYYKKEAVQITPPKRPKITVSTSQQDRDQKIWALMEKGLTPTETADWLNHNGYRPQRGEKFTMSSVHSIRKRLKKERTVG